VTFEEVANRAGNQASRIGKDAERPTFSRLLAQRRRRNVISAWSAAAVATLSIALVILVWPSMGISNPAATSPTLTGVPASCPVTVPGRSAFTPASETPEGPPSVYDEVWYGTPQLWTMINPQGEVNSKRWLEGDRTFWWSEEYSPDNPGEFTITAEQIDGPTSTVRVSEPAGSGFSPFMVQPTHESVTHVGIALPEPGCWRLTAEYKGATLSYVIWFTETTMGEFATYTDEGNVWIVSDCPNTDQMLRGNPDGLPAVDGIQTREEIEAWLGTGGNSKIVQRNGEAWDRNPDGSVFTLEVEDFMIEVTLEDESGCPGASVINNGVPVIYRIEGAP